MDHISTKLAAKLKQYVQSFQQQDNPCFSSLISNDAAEAYLAAQIPLLDCPDPELEEIYYFRWWVFRKHWQQTPAGHVLTEFLPQVPWSGPYNTINCAAGLHIREGRWLADPEKWLREYMNFWLDGPGDETAYSAWYAHALWEYCQLRGEYGYGIEKLPRLVEFYRRREQVFRQPNGLYWSCDDRDGMEYTISGSGLRPTINAYVYGDAMAISRFAALAKEFDLAREFQAKAAELKSRVDATLWDGDFYRNIPGEQGRTVYGPADVRELAGYLPWYFGMADEDKAPAFRWLLREDGFAAPKGLTTAERTHPRYMEPHDHECLWNGPVWPFATSQTLVAVSNLLRSGAQSILTPEDYYRWLVQYAQSQHRFSEMGTQIPWIDEDLDPETGEWISRAMLERWNWKPELGGRERGKDYNHSLFCDLVLSGLLGISANPAGLPEVSPMIPSWWGYFCVDNLHIQGGVYRILYDRDGTHYGLGCGLFVIPLV